MPYEFYLDLKNPEPEVPFPCLHKKVKLPPSSGIPHFLLPGPVSFQPCLLPHPKLITDVLADAGNFFVLTHLHTFAPEMSFLSLSFFACQTPTSSRFCLDLPSLERAFPSPNLIL